MGKINVKYEEDTALVSVNSKRKVDKFLLELIIRELKLQYKLHIKLTIKFHLK